MLFNSWTFLLFFIVVFVVHRAVPGWTAKKAVLLLASYIFYAAWNAPYVLILWFSTSLDWWLARRIWRTEHADQRRRLLAVSVICNLGLLGFFKYYGFLLENFRVLLSAAGIDYQPPALDIALPIGISFYTFASLSYTIDVYRREVRGDWSLLDYALFVSFFPHLVAGPIVRAKQLLPQIAQPRRAGAEQVGWGLALLILGLFSKVVMADRVFAPQVEAVYANPAHAGAFDAWAAVLGFSGQIYYDFSGYSLCAIGLALCFGYVFPDNFRHPYGARGFSDFWRRWHITLSSWLRDYLYVPLGGNRRGEARTYVNLILTMLIGGLWHGASWMFVLWGGLHGCYLAIERALRASGRIGDASSAGANFGLTACTFLIVTLTWIPFRAPTVDTAVAMLGALFRVGLPAIADSASAWICFAAIAATLAWHYALRDSSLEQRFGRLNPILQTLVLGLCLLIMFLVSGQDERAFLYFQF